MIRIVLHIIDYLLFWYHFLDFNHTMIVEFSLFFIIFLGNMTHVNVESDGEGGEQFIKYLLLFLNDLIVLIR